MQSLTVKRQAGKPNQETS